MPGTMSLIAGGWSFRDVDHSMVPGSVVVVNDGLLHFKRPISAVVSMDRLWTEGRWQHLDNLRLPTFLRKSCLKHIKWQDDPWGWLHIYECERMNTTFGADVTQLNGRNSGAVALNYCYTQRPDTLYLFGFDMCLSPEGKAHWYPAYEWVKKGEAGGTGRRTYDEWETDFWHYARQFEAAGIRVWNVSPHSKIGAFMKISAKGLECGR